MQEPTLVPRPDQSPASSQVLFVCRANYCRSPMMEHLFRAAQADGQIISGDNPPWVATSAGIYSRGDLPAHPHTIRVLEERGIHATQWRSRVLTPLVVASADLILTAEPAQRRYVVEMVPGAVGRTFSLLSFVRWLQAVQHLPTERAGPAHLQLISRAAAGRALVQPLTEREQNVPDPLGHSLRRFRSCRGVIESAVAALAA